MNGVRRKPPGDSITQSALIGIVAIIIAAATCANRPPVIESITVSPDTVVQNGQATIEAVAVDPEGDRLRFEWHTEAGSLSSSTADTVTWFAPKLSGHFTIALIVRDSHENLTDTSFTVAVAAPGERLGAGTAGR